MLEINHNSVSKKSGTAEQALLTNGNDPFSDIEWDNRRGEIVRNGACYRCYNCGNSMGCS